eukprot:7585787-Alexandrium_andersonii.AAC.1
MDPATIRARIGVLNNRLGAEDLDTLSEPKYGSRSTRSRTCSARRASPARPRRATSRPSRRARRTATAR